MTINEMTGQSKVTREYITVHVDGGAHDITTRLPGPINKIIMGSTNVTVTAVTGSVITVTNSGAHEDVRMLVETYHTHYQDIGRSNLTGAPVYTDGPELNCFVIYTTAAMMAVL